MQDEAQIRNIQIETIDIEFDFSLSQFKFKGQKTRRDKFYFFQTRFIIQKIDI